MWLQTWIVCLGFPLVTLMCMLWGSRFQTSRLRLNRLLTKADVSRRDFDKLVARIDVLKSAQNLQFPPLNLVYYVCANDAGR